MNIALHEIRCACGKVAWLTLVIAAKGTLLRVFQCREGHTAVQTINAQVRF